ncbi:MAG: phospholipase D-like domain-containing protein [Pyrinomonadaceae bacterium]
MASRAADTAVPRRKYSKIPGAAGSVLPPLDADFISDSFDRVTGAELVRGNDVRLLIDATENYPEWLAAIRSAERRILFESYIIHEDEQGEIFAEALIEKAREGVEVKLIYDWLGGLGNASRSFWRRMRRGGVDVRCYNPPRLLDPLAFFSRDHRKTIVVDGRVAFVGGLCVGQEWVGRPDRDIPPWRDTGVKITGPAVADVEAAFAEVWATMGSPLDQASLTRRDEIGPAGTVALRVVQSVPGTAHLYRTDQLLAVAARERMWLTDAYFVGIPSYLQALKDAAADGVDVRILVPQSTDIGIIRETTRSTYRPLLEAGIRVFEWNGPMMHAKTAVFDGRFSRVGSTNLNVVSWFGNYELDVLVEDDEFAYRMEEQFEIDMANSTEIVLADVEPKKVPRKAKPARRGQRRRRRIRRGNGSMRKATAGALNAATSISTALANRSQLGPAESRLLFIAGTALLMLAVLFVFFPRGAAYTVVVLLLLLAIPTLIKAVQNYRNN